ncbi:MAG: hypothetical protein RMI91_12095 [Gemmatales bacterium]|nr:hypothetical protein [Gemmatales bacterium]MDW7995382.1 hypothetical protein [Gemmatales bacterium]
MLALSLEELRPFPEPEWLPPPDYSIWGWLAAFTVLALAAVGLIWWHRHYRARDADPSLLTLQKLLTLLARLDHLYHMANRLMPNVASPQAEPALATQQEFLARTLDEAHAALQSWWRQRQPATRATNVLQDVSLPAAGPPIEWEKRLLQLMAEMEQARFSGRPLAFHRVKMQLESASIILATLSCPNKRPTITSDNESRAVRQTSWWLGEK